MVNVSTKFGILFGSVAFVSSLNPVLAQETAPSAPPEASTGLRLDEIVVTARRREEALQTVPIAVQAFTGEALAQRNIQDATDLQRMAVSLTTYQQARDEVTLSIRGMSSSGASAQGQNPRVTAYFAEVPLQTADSGGPGRFFDLQNVQVLKGPQGTLFGRNSTGGAVLFEPQRPTDEFEGYVSGQIGRFDERQLEAALNVPVSETLAIRFAGKRSKRDGFTENLVTGQMQDDRDYWGGRVSAMFTPSDRFSNFLMFDYYKSDTNGSSQQIGGIDQNKVLTGNVLASSPLGGSLPPLPLYLGGNRPSVALLRTDPMGAIMQAIAAGGFAFAPSPILDQQLAAQKAGGPRVTLSSVDGLSRTRSWGITNITEFELNDNLMFKNIFGLRRFKQLSRYDMDGTALPLLDQTTPDGWSSNLRQITEELQLQGSALDGKLDFTLGGFLLWEKTPDVQKLIQVSVGTPSLNLIERKERSQAVFGQLSYDLSDLVAEGLSITAGYRYTHDYRWIKTDNRRDPAGQFPITSCSLINGCPAVVDESFNASSYNISLDWQVSPETLLYITHRRGYRAGGLNPQALDFGIAYEPETVTDVEAGLKADFEIGGMPARTNLALFRSKLKDAQVSESFSETNPVTGELSLINLIVNAAEATVKGLEVDAMLMPVEGLRLTASYALTDAEYGRFISRRTGEPELNRPFPFLAKHRLSLGAQYNMPLPGENGELNWAANWSYSSSYSLSVFKDPIGEENGYNQLDLSLEWANIAGSDVSASFFVNNVTKEVYKIGGVPIMSVLGTTSLVYNEPRTWGLRLNYRFGN
ncbi:MAG TPA: TonB-dependent receptor [Pedomonas sp.]|uniref:TonB-dependent receptor n=1 Tax=Pedomonas sp. TaxID=2976421 RepID=UPI002F3E235A